MAFETLRFTIENNDEDNTLYLNTSNRVKLMITLDDSTPDSHVTLDSGSEIIIDKLTDFLTVELMQQIGVEDGWNATVDGDLLILRPEQSFALTNDSPPITIAMTIAVADDIKDYSPNLKINYPGVQGIFGEGPFRLKLQILHQIDESKADLRDVIHSGYSGQDGTLQLAVSDSGEALAQEFEFFLQQRPDGDEVIAGDSTRFIVSFIYSDDAAESGSGALTSVADAADFTLTKAQGASDWQVEPRTDVANPNWILTPPADSPIVGSDSAATVVFRFGTVVTHLVAGLTRMDIRYENVPGFNDGYFTQAINKNPRVQIHHLTASPNPVVGPGGKLLLRWQSEHQLSLELTEAPAKTLGTSSRIDVSQVTEREWGINNHTLFQLKATGKPAINSKIAELTVNCLLPPVIKKFAASPALSAEFPLSVTKSWIVEGADRVLLNGDPMTSHSGSTGIDVQAPGYPSELTAVAGELSVVDYLTVQQSAFSVFHTSEKRKPLAPFAYHQAKSRLFTVNESGNISVFDLNDNERIDEIELDTLIVYLLSVENSKIIAFGLAASVFYLVDPENYSVRQMTLDIDISTAAFGSDLGKAVFAGLTRQTIDVVSVDLDSLKIDNTVTIPINSHVATMMVVEQQVFAFTVGQDLVVIDLASGVVDITNTPVDAMLGTLPIYNKKYQRLFAVNVDGDSLLSINPNNADIRPVAQLNSSRMRNFIAVSSDDETLFISFKNDLKSGVQRWDIQTQTLDTIIQYTDVEVRNLAATADGRYLYLTLISADNQFSVRVVALDSMETVFESAATAFSLPPTSAGQQKLALFNDELMAPLDQHKMAINIPADGALAADGTLVIDWHEYQLQASVAVGSGPHSMAIRDKGATLMVANGQGKSIAMVDTDSHRVRETLAVTGHPHLIATSATQSAFIVADQAAQMVTVIDSGHTEKPVALTFTPQCIAMAPLGVLGFIAGAGKLAVIDSHIARLQYTVDLGSGTYQGLWVAPDMRSIYLLRSDQPSVLRLDYIPQSQQFEFKNSVGLSATPVAMIADKNRNRLVILNNQPAIELLDLSDFTLEATSYPLAFLTMPGDITALPAGERFFVSDVTHNRIYMLDPDLWGFSGWFATGEQPGAVMATLNGKIWVANQHSDQISVLQPKR